MEHYDGPAFFRRKTVEKKAKKEIRKQVTKAPKVEYSHRNFHPSYIPPSVLNFQDSNLKQKYQVLIDEIRKDDESYLLLDENTFSEDIIDLVHYTITKDDSNMITESPKVTETMDNHDEIVENTLEISTPNKAELPSEKQIINEINDTEIEEAETTSSLANLSEEIEETQDHLENLREETQQFEQQQASLNESEENFHQLENNEGTQVEDETQDLSSVHLPEDENREETSRDSEVETKDLESHALSKSLSDIMNEENNAQRDLKIFSEAFSNEEKTKPELHATQTPVTSEIESTYQLPPLTLLPEPVSEDNEQTEEWALNQADILNETFKAFNVKAEVKDWTVGPTVTQFEITLALGVKVNKITNLADDLKLALAAKDIRIEAPIAGKSSVGIEIPNKYSRPVMLSEVLNSSQFKNEQSPLTIALGVDLFGIPQITNIHDMPHGLIAGATGSGKSVFINSLLISLLYKATPQQVKLLLIDPKTVELAPYADIPHLLSPVISDPQAATASLKWAVDEMNQRYEKLAAAGVRDIDAFNKKAEETGEYGLNMPYIVIIIDELADLMMTASAEIADYIGQITAKARACGIHLLVATQRPSVDVITGTMKNNIPTRIAFMVSSQVDSRTILDSAGAEKLLGRGDMLYLGNGKSQPKRLQGTYINDDKIDEIVEFVKKQGHPHYAFDPDKLKKKAISQENEDELLPRVLDYIVNEESTSTSKLQRIFSIGYNRAARIIEELEKKQYISPARGSKPRKVFLTQEQLDKIRGE